MLLLKIPPGGPRGRAPHPKSQKLRLKVCPSGPRGRASPPKPQKTRLNLLKIIEINRESYENHQIYIKTMKILCKSYQNLYFHGKNLQKSAEIKKNVKIIQK